ncbi:unnamed protein product [marine sediment metagenome]|uniref:ABC transporter domain-containing protein n=1 Tax=marine sediment metagenome TaxID=412755 RepID=X0ZX69_9ZZZZ
MSEKLLVRTESLSKYYPIMRGVIPKVVDNIKAVDDVNLIIHKSETLGLVGESGCGKSTLGKLISRLEEATHGKVFFEGENILEYTNKQIRKIRRYMQIIFQDPYSSLNYRQTVGNIIEEPLIVHFCNLKRSERRESVKKLMEDVGLQVEDINRYPHEFSGGQRQRIGIARALALKPKFIICDEPVSALDVSIQAQIINLLQELQEVYNLTYLFISHDLSVVKHISQRIAVMYMGRIVEIAENKSIYNHAMHPYTKALIAASPVPNPKLKRDYTILDGDIPNPLSFPDGCSFHPRCPYVFETCRCNVPELKEIEPYHYVCCFLFE